MAWKRNWSLIVVQQSNYIKTRRDDCPVILLYCYVTNDVVTDQLIVGQTIIPSYYCTTASCWCTFQQGARIHKPLFKRILLVLEHQLPYESSSTELARQCEPVIGISAICPSDKNIPRQSASLSIILYLFSQQPFPLHSGYPYFSKFFIHFVIINLQFVSSQAKSFRELCKQSFRALWTAGACC